MADQDDLTFVVACDFAGVILGSVVDHDHFILVAWKSL